MNDFLDKAAKMGYKQEQQTTYEKLEWLELTNKVGNWCFLDVLEDKEIEFTPTKGRMQGKLIKKVVFEVIVKGNNMEIVEGSKMQISPPGLLRYQLNRRKESFGYPFNVGIEYTGKDDEGRHQTNIVDKNSHKEEIPF